MGWPAEQLALGGKALRRRCRYCDREVLVSVIEWDAVKFYPPLACSDHLRRAITDPREPFRAMPSLSIT